MAQGVRPWPRIVVPGLAGVARAAGWWWPPPTTRTAKEGVAWTFALDADTYAPVRQT
ncbi:DUF6745 domain-containing protein [Nocardia sp. NPDC051981]|uniref:DUF6745 domain-containing protein n=1 Tax=Nocardia sp. NPDC051981 TaxID=3155417 RepID=UPI00344085E5